MVNQRSLANAGRAEKTVRLFRLDDFSDLVNPGPGYIADSEDLKRDAKTPDVRNRLLQRLVVNQVCLGEKNMRLNPTLIHHHQVSFKSAYIEVEVARLDNEGGIDVSRNYLILYLVARGFSTKE